MFPRGLCLLVYVVCNHRCLVRLTSSSFSFSFCVPGVESLFCLVLVSNRSGLHGSPPSVLHDSSSRARLWPLMREQQRPTVASSTLFIALRRARHPCWCVRGSMLSWVLIQHRAAFGTRHYPSFWVLVFCLAFASVVTISFGFLLCPLGTCRILWCG